VDIIVIHGSPGNGKTTISKQLHETLKSPWFEFGWIPEFTMLNPHTRILPQKEEQLAFENLVLVCKNYIKHGYANVILSDLNDIRMLDIPAHFQWYTYVIITLYSECDDVIKERILTRDNGNTYNDYEASIATNKKIKARALLPNEYRIRSDNQTVEEIAQQIINILHTHQHNPVFGPSSYNTNDYSTYFNKDDMYSSVGSNNE